MLAEAAFVFLKNGLFLHGLKRSIQITFKFYYTKRLLIIIGCIYIFSPYPLKIMKICRAKQEKMSLSWHNYKSRSPLFISSELPRKETYFFGYKHLYLQFWRAATRTAVYSVNDVSRYTFSGYVDTHRRVRWTHSDKCVLTFFRLDAGVINFP